jgi:hypothetical protein
MAKTIKILAIENVTHNVKRFLLEKPSGYKYLPGQATDVSINKPEWNKETRPFTFTSLNKDSNMELIVKGYPRSIYPEHKGMTETLHKLKVGDELIIDEPWGTINYKGPGVFIAGGAGITPFIAILRDLREKEKLFGNKLIFSSKTKDDVILERELRGMFPASDLVLTLTREEVDGYQSGRVDNAFLKKHVKDFSQHLYVCGPKGMVESLKKDLASLGAEIDSIVFEQ